VPDPANIQVTWHPNNLVADRGSRFREGWIEGDQSALFGKTRCTQDVLAPINLPDRQEEACSAIGMFPNDIVWLLQTEDTLIWHQKGVEYEIGLLLLICSSCPVPS